MAFEWGYCEHNGPQRWCEAYPIGSAGTRQSPIDIVTSECADDPDLAARPLSYRYQTAAGDLHTLTNTGAGWRVDYRGQSRLTGGPLQDAEYQLEQFHCHWGRDDAGSEHTVDGVQLAAEIHFVHYNTKYGSFAAAADQPDGLAVLGVFFDSVKQPEEGQQKEQLQLLAGELSKVTDALAQVQYRGQQTQIPACDPAKFLPTASPKYYTYSGSLTTPPLYESVTWIVFATALPVASQQLASFASLSHRTGAQSDAGSARHDDDDGTICVNYRPTVPLCGRQVFYSDALRELS